MLFLNRVFGCKQIMSVGSEIVNNVPKDNSFKVQRYMDTRSSLRQGTLARRRSNFKANQFPLGTEAARKAAFAPIRGGAFKQSRPFSVNKPRAGAPTIQKNPVNGGGFTVKKSQQQTNIGPMQNHQTLDSLFANMKEERKRVLSQQNNWSRRNGGDQPRVPWARGHMRN
ncbi:UNVERIFIED_CONTAM: hypothetical protein Scaly_0872800 [Sesamum calycinum]|uniref:Uncharacterized protein n=1 Tax=Sesamum calycinum TaxID=2727403 RepID=A0AAW2QW20_9LAMI